MPKKRAILKENKISTKDLACRLADIFGDTPKLALTDIRPCFHYDENRNRTDLVEAYNYTVTDMDTLGSFNVRVTSTTPVITTEELEEAEERVFIEFPMNETIVKPYRIEYGTATVSIVAPYAQLVNPDNEED